MQLEMPKLDAAEVFVKWSLNPLLDGHQINHDIEAVKWLLHEVFVIPMVLAVVCNIQFVVAEWQLLVPDLTLALV